MTPTEFDAALRSIGWSQRHLARLLECDINITTRWVNGSVEIPRSIERWLLKLEVCIQKHPPPDDWRLR